MFLCDKCHPKDCGGFCFWPTSRGACEGCRKQSDCYDCHGHTQARPARTDGGAALREQCPACFSQDRAIRNDFVSLPIGVSYAEAERRRKVEPCSHLWHSAKPAPQSAEPQESRTTDAVQAMPPLQTSPMGQDSTLHGLPAPPPQTTPQPALEDEIGTANAALIAIRSALWEALPDRLHRGAGRTLVGMIQLLGRTLSEAQSNRRDEFNLRQAAEARASELEARLAALSASPAEPLTLPEVGGDVLPMSLGEFERKCRVQIGIEQARGYPYTAVIGLLCDAVRFAREYATPPLPAAPVEDKRA